MARTLRETKPEQYTKEMEMRLRLNRDLNAPFEKDGHEYGDYDKYDKHTAEVVEEPGYVDDGKHMFWKNYQLMLKRMELEEGDHHHNAERQDIADTIENYKM